MELRNREDIESQYKWKLKNIYENNTLWEEDLKLAEQKAKELTQYKGKLAESANTLYRALKERDDTEAILEKLFVYARMHKDEDNTDTLYQGMVDRCNTIFAEVFAQISFYLPELSAMSKETAEKFMEQKSELKIYKFMFEKIFRNKEHVLSEREEELLALSSEMAQTADEVFSMFNDADVKFGQIEDENGNKTELTKGRYVTFLESTNRDVRKNAFLKMNGAYNNMRNTLAATYSGNVKTEKFFASVRKYNSTRESALDKNNIDLSVYDNLIDTIHNNLPKLEKYLELRKNVLKVDELHMYDLYVPMVGEFDKKYTFEEAKDIVIKALAPLGEQYITDLKRAFDERWIDVFESRGKTSGAYSWGTYLTHPYILLNFQGNIDSVFTLAHELGHSMHSYYSNKKQAYPNASYTLFVAEVASTVNESLLINYMLNNTEDEKERAYLLNHYLEEFRGTVFRQVMFAEFEKKAHAMSENREPLTTDTLCEMYYELNQKYFGKTVSVDKEIEIEWARIPHFYRSFYVYQYATGFSAATALSTAILKNGGESVSKYLDFLSSGGSKYPLDLLRDAGVDLSTPDAVEAGLTKFGDMTEELRSILLE